MTEIIHRYPIITIIIDSHFSCSYNIKSKANIQYIKATASLFALITLLAPKNIVLSLGDLNCDQITEASYPISPCLVTAC